MKIYIARGKRGERITASRHPFKQDSAGFILYDNQTDPETINDVWLPTNLSPSEGAIIDVRATHAEGYTPVEFEGCAGGVRDVLAGIPREAGYERWRVYAKVLKRQMAPLPVDF